MNGTSWARTSSAAWLPARPARRSRIPDRRTRRSACVVRRSWDRMPPSPPHTPAGSRPPRSTTADRTPPVRARPGRRAHRRPAPSSRRDRGHRSTTGRAAGCCAWPRYPTTGDRRSSPVKSSPRNTPSERCSRGSGTRRPWRNRIGCRARARRNSSPPTSSPPVHEPQLVAARGVHLDRERARNHFEVQPPAVAPRDLVEAMALIGDEAGEHVDAARRALRVRLAADVGRQVELLDQRNQVRTIGSNTAPSRVRSTSPMTKSSSRSSTE